MFIRCLRMIGMRDSIEPETGVMCPLGMARLRPLWIGTTGMRA